MFRVDNYQIVFDKRHSNIKTHHTGRFDIICRVYRKNEEWMCGYGVARLHPKDIPNKIIGKKIALTNALKKISDLRLGSPSQNKTKRTEIWKAFWEWVESWKKRKHIIELVDENLAFCTVCKGGEGELTTECCGRPMTKEECHRVYEIGNLDFINNKWTEK